MRPPEKTMLTPADFAACPTWVYNQDVEGYFKVPDLETLQQLEDEDIAQGADDLRILAEITLPNGYTLAGELVGLEDMFAIGLFVKNEIITINRHMRTRSREQVAKFLALTGLAGELSFDTLFPLRFESRWGGGSFNDFSGVFERPD